MMKMLRAAIAAAFLFASLGMTRQGRPLPNMVVDAKELAANVQIRMMSVTATDQAVVNGYLAGPGDFKILAFSTYRRNIGNADMVFGAPNAANPLYCARPSGGYWACNPDLYMLMTPTGYRAWQQQYNPLIPITNTKNGLAFNNLVASGGIVGITRKHIVCLETEYPNNAKNPAPIGPTPAGSNGYDCTYQGESAGWGDIYGVWMDGQWIDITNVSPGTYWLVVIINPDHTWPAESNYKDNSASVKVTVR